jgi:hypothetical protein
VTPTQRSACLRRRTDVPLSRCRVRSGSSSLVGRVAVTSLSDGFNRGGYAAREHDSAQRPSCDRPRPALEVSRGPSGIEKLPTLSTRPPTGGMTALELR